MARMSNLARLIKNKNTSGVAEQFLMDLNRTIEQENQNDRIPTKSYKPSSIGGCKRSIYYQLVGANTDNQPSGFQLNGICESGTSRHEILQNYVVKMNENGFKCRWVDVEEVLKLKQKQGFAGGTKIIEKQGMETKCENVIYNLRFLCDGIVEYNGKLYILEIKTESTHKFQRHNEPFADHKVQASCYSLCLGISDVIFIYEDRDNCNKKSFLIKVTDEMKQQVKNTIDYVDLYVDSEEVPPMEKTTKNCQYCNYRIACRKDGDTEEI